MYNDPQVPGMANPNVFRAVPIRRSGHNTAIKIAVGIVALLIALLLGLIVLLLIGFETGPVGLLIGLVSATIPVPLYVILVLWIDRYESEPPWMLATAFAWGALVAVFFALVLNTASGIFVAVLTNDVNAAEAFSAGISAPIVEESAKALILLIFFFLKKDEFDGVLDGIVYAAMVGLGFAMTENIQYYGRAVLHGGGGGLTLLFILRGMVAPFCSVRGRMGASFNALSRGGFSNWRACRQFNQTASELAFHRSRVARGIGAERPDVHEREADYLRVLEDLVRQLRTGKA